MQVDGYSLDAQRDEAAEVCGIRGYDRCRGSILTRVFQQVSKGGPGVS